MPKIGEISGMYEIEGFVPDGGAEDTDGLSFGDAGGFFCVKTEFLRGDKRKERKRWLFRTGGSCPSCEPGRRRASWRCTC